MTPYDARFFIPPAPLASVILRNPNTDENVDDVPMLIDTGADVTLVPLFAVECLGLSTSESDIQLTAFDGGGYAAKIVKLHLVFLNRIYRGEYIVIDQPYGIIGRNILTTVRLVFDGPKQIWFETK